MISKPGRRVERTRSEAEIVAAENLVIDAQFLVQEAMSRKGLSKTELAALIGVSKNRISQMMRPDANPSLRTLAEIFYALDDSLKLRLGSNGSRACTGGWENSRQVALDVDVPGSLNDTGALEELMRCWDIKTNFEFSASNDNPYAIEEDEQLELAAAA